jgi:hypothetical protein
MSTTWRITEADRDEQGFVKASAPAEPRSLADLLPKPEEIKQDARRQPWTRTELATLAAVVLCAAFVLIYAWATPTAPPVPPVPRVTAVATLQPTSAPTAAPTPAPALVGYFDFTDPASVAPITANQITRVVGQAGDRWRLVDVGSARVWIGAHQVPTGIPAADPLPDLTPRRPAPVAPLPAVQPVAPPVAPPAPCTQDIAQYVTRRQVLAGTLPIGEAVGFSCTSAAEAEANASAHEAEVRSNYAKTSEAGR